MLVLGTNLVWYNDETKKPITYLVNCTLVKMVETNLNGLFMHLKRTHVKMCLQKCTQ